MLWLNLRPGAVLEFAVILFQLGGIAALCLNRLLPASRWAARGRNGAILAVVGLAIAGALCGRLASEFALFAGLTMTMLLIGLTTGNGTSPDDSSSEACSRMAPEPNLAS